MTSDADPTCLQPPARSMPKFSDPDITAKGERRAKVAFGGYQTVWFNTGTLCNVTCVNCYIESSPKNDRLSYLSRRDVKVLLDEAAAMTPRPVEIGFTGGEPFMNPEFIGMLDDSLAAGFQVLVLTNAMKPMTHHRRALRDLNQRTRGQLHMRVSLDHYERGIHERERGAGTWQPAIDGLRWLAAEGFDVAVAGRSLSGETDAELRAGYGRLFAKCALPIDPLDAMQLVLFPEMDAHADVPEITDSCWGILGKSPGDVMCATSRMVVKRKGAARPVLVACTLLPYDPAFEMGGTLAEAQSAVSLNHRHCARFCVLGGASCSARG